MARRRKSPSKTRRFNVKFGIKPGSIIRPIWHVIRQSAVGIAWLLGIGGIVTAWMLGVPRLQAFAAQRHHADPHEVTIRFSNPPPWIKGEVADVLLRTATMQIAGDPLVRDDLVAVRHALLETGWFESIAQVRRVAADVVDVEARFVKPYTVIRDESGDHLVDINARLLPKTYPRGVRTNFIVISGAHFDRPRRAGLRWEGTDVTAGIALLHILDQQAWRKQVVEIDVSRYLQDGPIKLRTDRDCLIVWGGAPGEEPALEVLADDKISRLNFLFERHQRIDGHQTGELDITGEKAVVAR